MKASKNMRVNIRGMVEGMNQSFKSFGFGFILSGVLLYLILVAQFRSFIDPLLIMLAIPMGFIGVLIILPLAGTTLNVMSLMGVLMLIGIAGSNSILIVDFAHRLEAEEGLGGRSRHYRLPGASASDPDDLARHDHRHDSDGAEAGHRCRAIRTMALAIIGGLTRPWRSVHRTRCLSAGLRQEKPKALR